MSVARCSWCGNVAYGVVTAQGLAAPLYDCESDACWERSYKQVRRMAPRTWKLIGKSRRKQAPQPGPDLFDHLPGR